MFRVGSDRDNKWNRIAIVGLLTLSVAALGITIWVMDDLLREQEIVSQLIDQLPADGVTMARELAGEMRWQFRLALLVALNLVVTALAVMLLWRAYRTSQQSLRDLKALASDILNSMDQAVMTTDRQGTITSMNRRGTELLSPNGDLVGRPLESLNPTIPLDGFRQAFRSEQASGMRDFVISSAGNKKTLRAFCQSLHHHDGEDIGEVIQLRDVTERVLMDDRMRRMERYMGLGSLAAGLHHEIKNPLAALSLHVQLLEEELGESDVDDSILEMLGVIKTEVARVGGVLEGFRDFASTSQLNQTPVDLKDLIDRQVRLVLPQAEARGVSIDVQILADSLPSMCIDRIRMEQVLLNLLVNAMEAMPEGGEIQIRVNLVDGADSLLISVTDSGPGVPKELWDRVFDPYFTTKSEGTGMGLALCDKIVRQHGGSLDLQVTQTGSTFALTLPIGSSS